MSRLRSTKPVLTFCCMLILTASSLALDNPFLDVRDALAADGSLFNGPDRFQANGTDPGLDTLHGEVNGHWWEDSTWWFSYDGLDLYTNPQDNWADVDVPRWQLNTSFKSVRPEPPILPQWVEDEDEGLFLNGGTIFKPNGTDPEIFIVTGTFLVGAILWPHEEYVEQYRDGDLTELTDEHKVPIYWLASYRLYIPADYGTDTNRNGKALIIQSNGGEVKGNLPPWLRSQLDPGIETGPHLESNPNPTWAYHAGIRTARRLQVPVMQLTAFPNLVNTWKAKDANGNMSEGGISGYTGESRVDFPIYWSSIADEADPVRDHPQFMYAATYVRARTFLEGFFNPVEWNTANWSQWDEIIEEYDLGNTDRYIPIDNAIIEGGSKRGHAVWIAGLVDPTITAIIS